MDSEVEDEVNEYFDEVESPNEMARPESVKNSFTVHEATSKA